MSSDIPGEGLGPLVGDVSGDSGGVIGGTHETPPCEARGIEAVLASPAVRECHPGEPITLAEKFVLLKYACA